MEAKKFEIEAKDVKTVKAAIDAPTIYIDGIQGSINTNGIFRFGLYEDVVNVSQAVIERRIVTTLAMSEQTATDLAKYFNNLLESLDKAKDE